MPSKGDKSRRSAWKGANIVAFSGYLDGEKRSKSLSSSESDEEVVPSREQLVRENLDVLVSALRYAIDHKPEFGEKVRESMAKFETAAAKEPANGSLWKVVKNYGGEGYPMPEYFAGEEEEWVPEDQKLDVDSVLLAVEVCEGALQELLNDSKLARWLLVDPLSSTAISETGYRSAEESTLRLGGYSKTVRDDEMNETVHWCFSLQPVKRWKEESLWSVPICRIGHNRSLDLVGFARAGTEEYQNPRRYVIKIFADVCREMGISVEASPGRKYVRASMKLGKRDEQLYLQDVGSETLRGVVNLMERKLVAMDCEFPCAWVVQCNGVKSRELFNVALEDSHLWRRAHVVLPVAESRRSRRCLVKLGIGMQPRARKKEVCMMNIDTWHFFEKVAKEAGLMEVMGFYFGGSRVFCSFQAKRTTKVAYDVASTRVGTMERWSEKMQMKTDDSSDDSSLDILFASSYAVRVYNTADRVLGVRNLRKVRGAIYDATCCLVAGAPRTGQDAGARGRVPQTKTDLEEVRKAVECAHELLRGYWLRVMGHDTLRFEVDVCGKPGLSVLTMLRRMTSDRSGRECIMSKFGMNPNYSRKSMTKFACQLLLAQQEAAGWMNAALDVMEDMRLAYNQGNKRTARKLRFQDAMAAIWYGTRIPRAHLFLMGVTEPNRAVEGGGPRRMYKRMDLDGVRVIEPEVKSTPLFEGCAWSVSRSSILLEADYVPVENGMPGAMYMDSIARAVEVSACVQSFRRQTRDVPALPVEGPRPVWLPRANIPIVSPLFTLAPSGRWIERSARGSIRADVAEVEEEMKELCEKAAAEDEPEYPIGDRRAMQAYATAALTSVREDLTAAEIAEMLDKLPLASGRDVDPKTIGPVRTAKPVVRGRDDGDLDGGFGELDGGFGELDGGFGELDGGFRDADGGLVGRPDDEFDALDLDSGMNQGELGREGGDIVPAEGLGSAIIQLRQHRRGIKSRFLVKAGVAGLTVARAHIDGILFVADIPKSKRKWFSKRKVTRLSTWKVGLNDVVFEDVSEKRDGSIWKLTMHTPSSALAVAASAALRAPSTSPPPALPPSSSSPPKMKKPKPSSTPDPVDTVNPSPAAMADAESDAPGSDPEDEEGASLDYWSLAEGEALDVLGWMIARIRLPRNVNRCYHRIRSQPRPGLGQVCWIDSPVIAIAACRGIPVARMASVDVQGVHQQAAQSIFRAAKLVRNGGLLDNSTYVRLNNAENFAPVVVSAEDIETGNAFDILETLACCGPPDRAASLLPPIFAVSESRLGICPACQNVSVVHPRSIDVGSLLRYQDTMHHPGGRSRCYSASCRHIVTNNFVHYKNVHTGVGSAMIIRAVGKQQQQLDITENKRSVRTPEVLFWNMAEQMEYRATYRLDSAILYQDNYHFTAAVVNDDGEVVEYDDLNPLPTILTPAAYQERLADGWVISALLYTLISLEESRSLTHDQVFRETRLDSIINDGGTLDDGRMVDVSSDDDTSNPKSAGSKRSRSTTK